MPTRWILLAAMALACGGDDPAPAESPAEVPPTEAASPEASAPAAEAVSDAIAPGEGAFTLQSATPTPRGCVYRLQDGAGAEHEMHGLSSGCEAAAALAGEAVQVVWKVGRIGGDDVRLVTSVTGG